MSLLTRCPVCTTLYRVVPDQLRISEGWVKCGRCGDIFDASQHLIEAIIDPEPASGTEVASSSMEDPPSQQDFADDFLKPASTEIELADFGRPSVPDSSVGSAGHVEAETTSDAEIKGGSAPGLSYGLHPGDEPDAVTPTAGLNQPVDGDSGLLSESEAEPALPSESRQVRWDDEPTPDSTTTKPEEDALLHDMPVTFLQGDKRTAFWRKPLVRGALTLVCFAFGLTLAGQWAYLERDRLAAQWPELKPMLQAFCGIAKCEVQPLKRIQSLSVDSVGFHQLGKETYRLTFTVKNSSSLPLAIPYVELALTDAQDRPVYRRVFSSNDLGVAGIEIAAGADWSAIVALRVNSDALAERVFGYRLLVFYP